MNKKQKLLEALERIDDLVLENEKNSTSKQYSKDYNLLLDFIEE